MTFKINNRECWGAAVEGGVVDLSELTGHHCLRDAISAGILPYLKAMLVGRKADYALERATLLPVIPNPPKILCVGINYHDHRLETGREVPDYPVMFSRFSNTLVAHGESIIRPTHSEQLDFEGEIAVVIGRRGRNIKLNDAWNYVAGYAPFNDATIRDWQRHTHQWIPGKNFPSTGGFGPWMVTRDEIADGANVSLVTRLNGVEVQRTTTELMIFDIPSILAYCSQFTELEPGDVIATGTPGGIGGKRNPPLWMKDGDVIEVEIGQIGTLKNTVKNTCA